MKTKKVYFYKIYINDIKHIIKFDKNVFLVSFFKIIMGPQGHIKSNNKLTNKYIWFYIDKNRHGWMPQQEGFNFFINEGYIYGGIYGKNYLRKIKLNKLNESRR